jgi:hypothetical protein
MRLLLFALCAGLRMICNEVPDHRYPGGEGATDVMCVVSDAHHRQNENAEAEDAAVDTVTAKELAARSPGFDLTAVKSTVKRGFQSSFHA